MKYLKFILLFLNLLISTCFIAQGVGNNNKITDSFNNININQYIYRTEIDTTSFKKISQQQKEEIIDSLSIIYKNLQNNLSYIFQDYLLQTNKKDSAIFKQIDIITKLMSDNKLLNKKMDSLITTIDFLTKKNAKFNPKSLIPSWVQFERDDKFKGHLFLWTEIVFIPSAAVSWSQYYKFKKSSESPSRNQNIYETNRDICLGLGISTTALAVGFYIWNIIDGNTNKDKIIKNKEMAFMPYATKSEYGIALSLRF